MGKNIIKLTKYDNDIKLSYEFAIDFIEEFKTFISENNFTGLSENKISLCDTAGLSNSYNSFEDLKKKTNPNIELRTFSCDVSFLNGEDKISLNILFLDYYAEFFSVSEKENICNVTSYKLDKTIKILLKKYEIAPVKKNHIVLQIKLLFKKIPSCKHSCFVNNNWNYWFYTWIAILSNNPVIKPPNIPIAVKIALI